MTHIIIIQLVHFEPDWLLMMTFTSGICVFSWLCFLVQWSAVGRWCGSSMALLFPAPLAPPPSPHFPPPCSLSVFLKCRDSLGQWTHITLTFCHLAHFLKAELNVLMSALYIACPYWSAVFGYTWSAVNVTLCGSYSVHHVGPSYDDGDDRHHHYHHCMFLPELPSLCDSLSIPRIDLTALQQFIFCLSVSSFCLENDRTTSFFQDLFSLCLVSQKAVVFLNNVIFAALW